VYIGFEYCLIIFIILNRFGITVFFFVQIISPIFGEYNGANISTIYWDLFPGFPHLTSKCGSGISSYVHELRCSALLGSYLRWGQRKVGCAVLW